jgi:predicted transcriptional regulator
MDFSKLKAELHQLIDQVNDEETLYQIRTIIEIHTDSEHDWADDLSENAREALERSIAQADAGNVFSHEEVMKLFREKYGR